MRDIASAIGRHLQLPVIAIPREAAADHFGFLGAFFFLDLPASRTLTQQHLGWHPVELGLLEDPDQDHYFDNEM